MRSTLPDAIASIFAAGARRPAPLLLVLAFSVQCGRSSSGRSPEADLPDALRDGSVFDADVDAAGSCPGEDASCVEIETADVRRGDAGADAAPFVPTQCAKPVEQDLTQYVDPFIGTQGSGNVIPGPALPHGMVKLSPDTVGELGTIDGYEYGAQRIEGFSHTHFEGPGGSGYGLSEILLVPAAGDLALDVQTLAEKLDKFSCAFAHEDELAKPGYYRVGLPDCAAAVELAATQHCGVHRYAFTASGPQWLVLDVGHTRGQSVDGVIAVIDDQTLSGFGTYHVHPLLNMAAAALGEMNASRRTVYFHARLDRKILDLGAVNSKGEVSLEEKPADAPLTGKGLKAALLMADGEAVTVEARVCISLIDEAHAQKHFAAEVEGRTLEDVAASADAEWNSLLNRVQVTGGSQSDLLSFYTALYHSFLQPVDYTEEGKYWIGFDGTGKVKDAAGLGRTGNPGTSAQQFKYYTDDWCMWDTFRTGHPLQVLVEPERAVDKVRSYLAMYKDSGWLPKCPWAAQSDSRVMIGNHVACFITDTYLKGFSDFDLELAWEAIYHNSMEDDIKGIPDGGLGFLSYGTLPSYVKKGYIPQEEDEFQSASLTLEYAYDDWCVANFADALGKADDAAYFRDRSHNYMNHWDDETGFMRPKMKSGAWMSPFDPAEMAVGFCEATSWIYTWFVPHDVDALVQLMGGPEQFTAKLDEYFVGGHHDPSNQPGFHTPFLYVWAGRPDRTQEQVRSLMQTAFSAKPDGLPGNDDSGAMSAWLVFAALGLYPVAPGDPSYVLTSPLFEEAVIRNGADEGCFVISAPGSQAEKPYIASASLNGTPYPTPWLSHSKITSGALLEFQRSAAPTAWGKAD